MTSPTVLTPPSRTWVVERDPDPGQAEGCLFAKPSSAVLDFALLWHRWLGGDTVVSSTWAVPAGITKTADTWLPDYAQVWLSGGTEGERYDLVNTVTTYFGRTQTQTITIVIEER